MGSHDSCYEERIFTLLSLKFATASMVDFPEVTEFLDLFYDMWNRDQGMKLVIIMRGLPGSGKSMFVDELTERATALGIRCAVCSADAFFYNDDGQYIFNRRDLSANHQKCVLKFRRHLNANVNDFEFANLIIVDNTNIKLDEMDTYIDGSRRAGVEYCSFRFKCRVIEEAALQCLRSVHKVPLLVALSRYDLYVEFLDDAHEKEVIPRYEDLDAYRLEGHIPNLDE